VRYDGTGTDQKTFLPFTYCEDAVGNREWRCQGMPEPRPLFNLDVLAAMPDAPVAVFEGEKSAARAARIFPGYVCTTSPGGSQAASKVDWGPIAGRGAMIWPDADEPGAKYADTVAAILQALGCEVSVIEAAALASLAPEGGSREPEGF
jgi:putative DNA primase/helicase